MKAIIVYKNKVIKVLVILVFKDLVKDYYPIEKDEQVENYCLLEL